MGGILYIYIYYIIYYIILYIYILYLLLLLLLCMYIYICIYIYTWNPIMSLVFKVLGHKIEASPSKIDVGCLDLPSRSARWFFSRGDVGFLRWWYQNHWFIDVYFMENPKEKYGWWLGIPLMEPPISLCEIFSRQVSAWEFQWMKWLYFIMVARDISYSFWQLYWMVIPCYTHYCH